MKQILISLMAASFSTSAIAAIQATTVDLIPGSRLTGFLTDDLASSVSESDHRTITVFNIQTGKPIATRKPADQMDMSVSAQNGVILASEGIPDENHYFIQRATVTDFVTGEKIGTIGDDEFILYASKKGTSVQMVTYQWRAQWFLNGPKSDDVLKFYDSAHVGQVSEVPLAGTLQSGGIEGNQVSTNGRYFAYSTKGSAVLFDLVAKKPKKVVSTGDDQVPAMGLSDDGQRFFTYVTRSDGSAEVTVWSTGNISKIDSRVITGERNGEGTAVAHTWDTIQGHGGQLLEFHRSFRWGFIDMQTGATEYLSRSGSNHGLTVVAVDPQVIIFSASYKGKTLETAARKVIGSRFEEFYTIPDQIDRELLQPSPNGRCLTLATSAGLKFIDSRTQEEYGRAVLTDLGSTGRFQKNGKVFVVSDDEGTKLYRVKTPEDCWGPALRSDYE